MCMFCDDYDTPEHQELKHKGSQVSMIECDKDHVPDFLKEAHQTNELLPQSYLHQHAEPLVETLALKVQSSICDVLPVPDENKVRSLSQQVSKDDDKNWTHQVFDEMPERELYKKLLHGDEEEETGQLFYQIPRRITSKIKSKKYLKSWKFKFKTTAKKYKLKEDWFCFMDEMEKSFVNMLPVDAARLKKFAKERLKTQMEERKKLVRRRRVVLVPVPAQGHITPMMQLARVLHSKGFSITVAQTKFNYLNPSDNLSDFQFVTILENLPESDFKNLGPGRFLIKLAKECCVGFKEWLGHFLVKQQNISNEEIACVIYDEFMYFVEAAVKEFKLHNVILSTTSATAFVCRFVMCKLYAKDGLALLKEGDRREEELVPDIYPIRYKDLQSSIFAPVECSVELFKNTCYKGTASSVIINTVKCLEISSLEWLQRELEIPVYPIDPLHMVAPSPLTSLLEENDSCIEWLDKLLYVGVNANMSYRESAFKAITGEFKLSEDAAKRKVSELNSWDSLPENDPDSVIVEFVDFIKAMDQFSPSLSITELKKYEMLTRQFKKRVQMKEEKLNHLKQEKVVDLLDVVSKTTKILESVKTMVELTRGRVKLKQLERKTSSNSHSLIGFIMELSNCTSTPTRNENERSKSKSIIFIVQLLSWRIEWVSLVKLDKSQIGPSKEWETVHVCGCILHFSSDRYEETVAADLCVHAELHGTSSTVIKNHKSEQNCMVRFNYTAEERKTLVELVSYIESVGSMLQRCDTLATNALWETTIHAEVHDFVQDMLATILRITMLCFSRQKCYNPMISKLFLVSSEIAGFCIWEVYRIQRPPEDRKHK